MSSINPVQRIHKRMVKEINDIIEYRNNNGLKKLTFVQVSNLIVRHKDWIDVKNDIVTIGEYEDGKNE